jgi:hypothetical protein
MFFALLQVTPASSEVDPDGPIQIECASAPKPIQIECASAPEIATLLCD